MPTEIQTPRQWLALAEEFKLTGRHLLQLDEVIVPVVLVSDLSSPAAALNQKVVYYFNVPASAVANGKAVLFNGVTADTGRDIIIERIVMSMASAQSWELRFTTNAPIAPIAAAQLFKNFRQDPQVGIVPGNMFADSGAITGELIMRPQIQANTFREIEVDIRLGDRRALSLQVAANNVQFRSTWFGRVVPRL